MGGVIYRPIIDPPTYAEGAKEEAYAIPSVNQIPGEPSKGLLTSNGAVSDFLVSLMTELEVERVPQGGVGNKVLLLLEGHGSAYIQDRGVSRWDTCAAQAVLEAHGGTLSKLTTFQATGEQSSYNYRRAEHNLDWDSNGPLYEPWLTPQNAADGVTGVGERKAVELGDVKPYSNLCGLLALSARDSQPERLAMYHTAVVYAASSSPAQYS